MNTATLLLLLLQPAITPPSGGPSSTPVNPGRIVNIPGGTRRIAIPR